MGMACAQKDFFCMNLIDQKWIIDHMYLQKKRRHVIFQLGTWLYVDSIIEEEVKMDVGVRQLTIPHNFSYSQFYTALNMNPVTPLQLPTPPLAPTC